jgi:hypothetical protein
MLKIGWHYAPKKRPHPETSKMQEGCLFGNHCHNKNPTGSRVSTSVSFLQQNKKNIFIFSVVF